MEAQSELDEGLVRFRRHGEQQFETNFMTKDDVVEDLVTPARGNASLIHTMFSLFQSQLSTINAINVDVFREVYELSHLLMRIFFISNRIISILFNAITLFLVTLRAIFHISQFVLINTTRITRTFRASPPMTSSLSDVGLFILEILILGVLLFKIFVPICIYMAAFIINVICYYVPRSLSILLSPW